jgi:tRNA 2-thiouridine synthesizing protein A
LKERNINNPAFADLRAITPDKRIDIRGLVCPYTFVKAKLAIESMATGQVLEILLDYEEASRSIPKSMTEQGHTLLRTEKITDKDWVLLIQKGNE